MPTGVTPAHVVLALMQNVPNPTHGSTVVPFALPVAGPVDLAIYDVLGRRVRSLVRGMISAGAHNAAWDRRDEAGHRASPGLYFYKMTALGRTFERRMVVLE